MIRIKQPALVVHAHDVPGYKYQMKWTWKMLPGAAARDIVNWILHANNGQFGAQKQRLENVIINCHGAPGSLFIGGTGSPALDIKSVGVFSALQGCDIGAIWLVACEVANQQGVATGGSERRFAPIWPRRRVVTSSPRRRSSTSISAFTCAAARGAVSTTSRALPIGSNPPAGICIMFRNQARSGEPGSWLPPR